MTSQNLTSALEGFLSGSSGAVVMEDGATLWVAAGWRARLHASGAIVLTPARTR